MPHPADIHVGKRLRLRRTIMGLSQEAIGNAIGVSFQQIQKYERGVNRMGASRLYEFCKILLVPVSYFFENMEKSGTSVSHSSDSSKDGHMIDHETTPGRETLEMMRAYYRITDSHVRKRVFELVKSLADDVPVV